MNAISFKALPHNTAFTVKPMDDSNQNMILKQKFEHLLKILLVGLSFFSLPIVEVIPDDKLGGLARLGPERFLDALALFLTRLDLFVDALESGQEPCECAANAQVFDIREFGHCLRDLGGARR